MIKKMEYLTPEAKAAFIPCRSCSNIMTKECWEACMPEGRFEYYHHRSSTDIQEMKPFPIKDTLEEPDPYKRLLNVCIYLTAVVDYLQNTEEYQRNKAHYKELENGRQNIDNPAGSSHLTDLQSQAVPIDIEEKNTAHKA